MRKKFIESSDNNIDKIFEEIFDKNKDLNNLMLLREILDKLSDGVYITDGKGLTIFVNKAYERISGTSRNLFIGKKMEQVIKEGLINTSGTLKVIENLEEVTINQILNNKNQVVITSTPIFSKNSEISIVVTTVRDVTEINELKDKLDESEQNILMLKYLIDQESKVIYNSHIMKMILNKAKKVANYDVSVLITGETGVGKDVIAKYIYEIGSRKDGPFVEINCSAIPANLIESELFGYESGAFTGALKKGKKGIFEIANNGTVFLDEIGELPLELQAKLLKVIQNKKIRKIGADKDIPIDVRIISATNRDLEKMVSEKSFRQDLYYRINVIPIHIPPLRERREDIIPLALHFLRENNKINKTKKYFSDKVLRIFYKNNWYGNVRELKNIVERVVILSRDNCIEEWDLLEDMVNCNKIVQRKNIFESGSNLDEMLDSYEKKIIKEVIDYTNSQKEASKILGITESKLCRRIKKLKI